MKMAIEIQLDSMDQRTQSEMSSGLLLRQKYSIPRSHTSTLIKTIPLAPWGAFGGYPYVFGSISKNHLEEITLSLKR